MGDKVFLTEKGSRLLRIRGFTERDFDVTKPLEVVEIREIPGSEVVYMLKIAEADDAVVDFERDGFDFEDSQGTESESSN